MILCKIFSGLLRSVFEPCGGSLVACLLYESVCIDGLLAIAATHLLPLGTIEYAVASSHNSSLLMHIPECYL
jgi:hypothetical protein